MNPKIKECFVKSPYFDHSGKEHTGVYQSHLLTFKGFTEYRLLEGMARYAGQL